MKSRPGRSGRKAIAVGAPDPEAFAARALGFGTLAADSSSLIVLAAAGAATAAASLWRLAAVPAVRAEIGGLADRLALAPLVAPAASGPGAAGADRDVVAAAERENLPVLAEDMKVLRAAEDAGLDAFDGLVAVEVLAARGALNWAEAEAVRLRLRSMADYPPRRLSWAAAVAAALAKLA
jgi:hypothetical protein